jgi:UDP-N-acetyl-2-amino-2-deoxyglucuronate dehydrogenase
MKPLRTGVIGCGHIATRHLKHLAVLEDVELTGFCDRNMDRAAAFSKQYGGGGAYSDCRAMFEALELDLVYICLAPFAHSDEVELACRHGVHFLIEKPIALTIEQALTMAEHVRAKGVKSQVGFMYRHGEATQWLKRHLAESTDPPAAFMSGRYACNSLHRWWWRDRSKSGGQLLEQIIHLLDLSRYFLGEPVQVYSAQENLFHRDVPDYTVEDVSATVIRFASGALAVISATNGAIPGRWDCDWRVVLPDLTADFQDANHAVFHNTRQAWPSAQTVASDKDLFLAQTLDLLAAIREDRSTAAPIEEGLRSLQLALTAAHSAEQDAPVAIELLT